MKKLKRIQWLTTIAVLSLTVSCTTLPKRPENLARSDYESLKPYISRLIEKEMKANDVTGLSIALVDDQKVV